MIFEGAFVDNAFKFEDLRNYAIMSSDAFATSDGGDTIYKYALKESDYPTLILTDPLKDEAGNILMPGHYELAISDMRDYFILMQSKKPLAIFPVFKVEEDMSQIELEKDKDYQKIKKRQEKERKKVNKKRREAGMTEDEEKIPMEASIEYIKDGDYFLIKYERGTIRAWSAIKSSSPPFPPR